MGVTKNWLHYSNYLNDNPQLALLNSDIGRNEGLANSLKNDLKNG